MKTCTEEQGLALQHGFRNIAARKAAITTCGLIISDPKTERVLDREDVELAAAYIVLQIGFRRILNRHF